MTKELHCRDLGFDCDAVVTADSDEEIFVQVVEHGQSVHDIPADQLRDPAFVATVRGQIHERDEDH